MPMTTPTHRAAAAVWVLLQCSLAAAAAGSLHPVVLVPGFISSMLEARLTPAYQPGSPECAAHVGGGWFRLWLNNTAMREPGGVACFGEQSSLHYDHVADDYRNTAGVKTRVPFFGSTKGVLYTNPHHKNETAVMAKLVARLEAAGYRDGATLFGAPYDFRYALAAPGNPNAVGNAFLRRLKTLIEGASRRCGGKKVVIVTHSFGSEFVHQLVVRSTMSWRRRYVKRLVFLAMNIGGIPLGMYLLASGSNFFLPYVDPLTLRPAVRSYTTMLWALPAAAVYSDTPLVTTPHKNYSAYDLYEFFNDIGFDEGIIPYVRRIAPMVEEIPPPYVPVTLIHGDGVPTPERYYYSKGFDAAPEVATGNGDGLVNEIVVDTAASRWSSAAGQEAVKVLKLKNVSHSAVLTDDSALDLVMLQILRD